MHDLDTTVVAIATPPGRGGVGCLRLSGSRAAEIGAELFRPVSHGGPATEGGRPCFGTFLARDRSRLDHGYLVLFPAGRSFTGEQTAELWPHGSPVVLAELLEGAVAAGALLAGPGEMTYRALCNDRIDLSRAEAVRDLVEARTRFQARVAFAQAEGAVARRVNPMVEGLAEWIARSEAAVEFVDESETHLAQGALGRAIEDLRQSCDELLAGFRTGRVLREGARLVIVGRPNAGKSSLFNRLLSEERAIVTEFAGTTRDTLSESLDLDGIPVQLTDTAGLRDVPDPVEREGVRRARQAREEADLVLLVLDGSREPDRAELAALAEATTTPGAENTVAVITKCDLEPAARPEIPEPGMLRVSSETGQGIDALRTALREHLVGSGTLEDPVVTNSRHAGAIDEARAALDVAAGALADGLTEELVLEDLKLAMNHLGRITGEFTTEDLYDRIFSTFCIGK